MTRTFKRLAKAAGLPADVWFHAATRHGHASMLLAAGVDIAIVSKRLRHSSISITSDTYSHLLEGVGRRAAEAASALLPARSTPECDDSVTAGPRKWISTPAARTKVLVKRVRRQGLEPRTRRLRVCCSAS